MATVSKEIADRIVAGEFADDMPQSITEYDNAFGGVSYGVVFAGDSPDKYCASEFVFNPRLYWAHPVADVPAYVAEN